MTGRRGGNTLMDSQAHACCGVVTFTHRPIAEDTCRSLVSAQTQQERIRQAQIRFKSGPGLSKGREGGLEVD